MNGKFLLTPFLLHFVKAHNYGLLQNWNFSLEFRFAQNLFKRCYYVTQISKVSYRY